jgi:hypothetical protein
MSSDDLQAAWADVHEATAEGWYVGRPGWEDHYRQWSMYAFDPKEKAVVGRRERQWIAVGQTELD